MPPKRRDPPTSKCVARSGLRPGFDAAVPNCVLNRSKIVGKRARRETLAWNAVALSGFQSSRPCQLNAAALASG